MSDEAQPGKSPEDALLGLTSLDFGPAWARGGGEKKGGTQEEKGKRDREDRGGDRRGDQREGRRDDRREGRRDDRRDGRGDDRRDGKGGKGRRFDDRNKGEGGRRFEKGGRGRRDDDRRGPPREEISPPEGYTAQVMPVEDGLDGLAKEILAGGRTYSVFDLAKLVLGARERFNVSFRSGGEGGLIRCKKDGTLWLTREEAVQHFLRSDWRKEYYEEVVSQAEAPRGNFQTVARCGLSNEWLGPPNYHGYQPAVMQLHRERFSNMPLDAYKRKIRMERGEEAVNAWLEKMSKRVAYRPTGGVVAEVSAREESPAAEDASEGVATETSTAEGAEGAEAGEGAGEGEDETSSEGTQIEETPAGSEGEVSEEPVAEGGDDAREEGAPSAGDEAGDDESGEELSAAEGAEENAEPPPAAAVEEPLLEDLRLVERHFVEHHFEEAFHVTNRAWVSGNIKGNHLSPGLLALLRLAVAEEQRYPGKLTPMLCRQLSGRHVAVFKWRRKLKAGPSRPHPVPEDITIADRPMALLTWISENSGRKLEGLWKALLPPEVSDEEKRGWYHDLHWLLNQGYALLMADSTVHLAKKSDEVDRPPAKGKAKKGRQREDRKKPAKDQDQEAAPSPRGREQKEPAPAPAPSPEREREREREPERARSRSGSPGLYALGGCTLSGIPKSPEALTGRGLWPLLSRSEADEDDDGEGDEEGEDDWF